MGRFIRQQGLEDYTSARVFIPFFEPILSFAAAIERAQMERIRVEGEEAQRRKDGNGGGGLGRTGKHAGR